MLYWSDVLRKFLLRSSWRWTVLKSRRCWYSIVETNKNTTRMANRLHERARGDNLPLLYFRYIGWETKDHRNTSSSVVTAMLPSSSQESSQTGSAKNLTRSRKLRVGYSRVIYYALSTHTLVASRSRKPHFRSPLVAMGFSTKGIRTCSTGGTSLYCLPRQLQPVEWSLIMRTGLSQ